MDGTPVKVIAIHSEVEKLGVADGLGDVKGLLLLGWPHIEGIVAEACRSLLQTF